MNSHFAVRSLDAWISDFVGLDSVSIAKRYRSADVTVVTVSCRALDLVMLVCISPIDHAWSFFRPGDARRSAWYENLCSRADGGELAQEVKASKIRARSLPNGLFEVGDVERYLHPSAYLNSWYRVLEVPKDLAEQGFYRVKQWISELGAYSLLQVPDARTTTPDWGMVTTQMLSVPDHDLFADLWAQERFRLWSGEKGIYNRLLHQIGEIQKTGKHQLELDEQFIPAIELPMIGRKNLRTSTAASRWIALAREAGVGPETVNLKNLDCMFSAYARFANVLDWPQLQPSGRAILTEEESLVKTLPLAGDCPFDAIDELSEFVQRQEQRFPVLCLPPLLPPA